ncbi:MAG: type I-MYXAN CRISPR-associated protein Cmx8 [Dehalococcoidia bacterium]
MTKSLVLEYSLHELPTAQHRAGLAGLVILADLLHRKDVGNAPDVTAQGSGHASLTLTEESLTELFDYLYDASNDLRAESRKRRDNKTQGFIEPEKVVTTTDADPRTGKPKENTKYYYPVLAPAGRFLTDLQMPESWVRLWRDVTWRCIRARPTTRNPYKQRAAGGHVQEAAKLWQGLQRADRAVDLASTIFLGAQDANAERVPFRGMPSENLLLHFWPVVMGFGEARRLAVKNGQVKEEGDGFAIVIPDVADLQGFTEDFRAAVAQLGSRMSGYRPADAIVSLPAEGALEYMRNVSALVRARAQASDAWFSLAGVEVYHLRPTTSRGAELASTTVLAADEAVLEGYEAVRDRYRSLAFRRQLIRNLLRASPWHRGFDRLFATFPEGFFLGQHDQAQWFARDVSRKFQTEMPQAGSAT